jgi:hypothetical protein
VHIRNITGPDLVYPCRSVRSFNQVARIYPLALHDRGFHDIGAGDLTQLLGKLCP